MEQLYNGILLPDNFTDQPSNADTAPYLENPPEVIDVSIGRQLFVDSFLTAESSLTPVFHKAKKYEGNPVLKAETPWEIAQSPVACPKSGGVWFDEKEHIFKMWYEAGWLRQMAYAVSDDGIHWERPDLHEVEGTNLILPYDGYREDLFFRDTSYLRTDSTTVFIDDTCDPSERYKLYLRNPGGGSPGIVAVSGDGIHFRDFRLTTEVFDRSTMFNNPFRKKWVYSIRDMWHGRSRTYRECDDYLAGALWEPSEAHHWLACDDRDEPEPYIGFAPQLYNVDCVGYESIMLGMFQIMYGPENNICEAAGVPKITELQPMFSRDGYHFVRPFRESIIQASRTKGSWDRGYVQSVGGVTVIHGDELWIYYAGFGGDEAYKGQAWYTNGIYRNGATGIARIRRDGFVSQDSKDGGMLLTRPVCFTGKTELHLNAVGKVTTEILDMNGAVLAKADFCGDSTDAALVFDDFNIAGLDGIPHRLRFTVNGSLYSCAYTDAKG
ncbi:MAG: glycosyl hydrolase family 32, partial [Clostridia bacterium]|nr:glycosyl hydrolase family 32 [Clostridia bacterium]